MLFMVYAPNTGEPFEVRPDRARDLVINYGWSMEPQKPAVVSTQSAVVSMSPPPSALPSNTNTPAEDMKEHTPGQTFTDGS